MSDVLVESTFKELDTDVDTDTDLDDVTDVDSDTVSTASEQYSVRHRSFVKCSIRLEHNLHVVQPSVRAVVQLSQTMLGGVQLIDFKALLCVRVLNVFICSMH